MDSDFIQYAMLHSCHCFFQCSNYPRSGLWEPLQADFFFFFVHLFWVMAFIEPVHQFCFEWVFCLSSNPQLASLKAEGQSLQSAKGSGKRITPLHGKEDNVLPLRKRPGLVLALASLVDCVLENVQDVGGSHSNNVLRQVPGCGSWENQYYWLSLWVLQLALYVGEDMAYNPL